MKKALCLLSLLVLSSSDVRAGVQPVGAEFHASTCASCRKWASSVAGATSGTFAVVWEGTSSADSRGILARFYTKNGAPRGKEVQANKDKDPAQYDAVVAADAQGNYIVAWSQVADHNSDVFVQRFKPTGVALGTAVRVNVDDPAAPVPPSDAMPAVAATPNGFVVTWIRLILPSATSEGTRPEIWFRRFDKNAAPLGAPIKLNGSLARGQRPSVCVSKAGQAVVAWSTVNGYFPFEPSKYGVALRRIAASGAPAGAEVVVARPTADVLDATASCAADGSYVIVWRSNLAPATDESDLFGLRFNAKGKRVGGVFRINSTLPGEQRSPSVSHDAAGNFVVVWLTRDPDTRRVVGRRYKSNGAADGAELTIYQPAEDMPLPGDPDVAHVGSAGEFVVVWPVGSDDLIGRRFKITAARR